jgi:hypothetical protein
MMPNGNDDYKNQAATTARVTTMVARATVTGAKRAMATMATMATTATMVTMGTIATMATMTPNSNNVPSGDKSNKDTKQWQGQQRQWRMMAVINPAEAQDATIVPTAMPRWRLRHHTVVSHRIDPTGEYIENLEQKKKPGPQKKSGLVGRPTNPDLLQND